MRGKLEFGGPPITRFYVITLFALIFSILTVVMGGVVRVTGSGLGCPDWPLCHGNVIPPWEIAPWLEYMHRLSASLAGISTIVLLVVSIRTFKLGHRITKIVALITVLLLVQATLGAYTVLSELSPIVAIIHTAVGISYVAVLVIIFSVFDKTSWQDSGKFDEKNWKDLKTQALILSVMTFVLLLSGTYVTRTLGSPSACMSFPLCGTPLQDMTSIHWIHMSHRLVSLLVILILGNTIVKSLHLYNPAIKGIIYLIAALLTMQVILGLGNVLLRLPTEIRALHVAVGILFFTTTTFLAAKFWHEKILGAKSI